IKISDEHNSQEPKTEPSQNCTSTVPKAHSNSAAFPQKESQKRDTESPIIPKGNFIKSWRRSFYVSKEDFQGIDFYLNEEEREQVAEIADGVEHKFLYEKFDAFVRKNIMPDKLIPAFFAWLRKFVASYKKRQRRDSDEYTD